LAAIIIMKKLSLQSIPFLKKKSKTVELEKKSSKRKYIYYTIGVIALVGLIYEGNFLYNNVLLGLDRARQLSERRVDVVDTTVDITLFNEISANLNEKTLGINLERSSAGRS